MVPPSNAPDAWFGKQGGGDPTPFAPRRCVRYSVHKASCCFDYAALWFPANTAAAAATANQCHGIRVLHGAAGGKHGTKHDWNAAGVGNHVSNADQCS